MQARSSTALVVPALVVAVIAVSFAAVLFRAAPELHPLSAAGWRLIIAGLVLTPFLRHLPRTAWRKGPFAGLAYALHFGCWVASLGLLSVLVSTTIVTTTPLMLAAFALVTGRDRPRARALFGMALGSCGVVLLATSMPSDGSDTSLHGVLLALVGAATGAVYLVTARSVQLPTMRASLAFSGVAALTGGVLLIATAAIVGAPLLPQTAEEAWVIIGAAALPQLVGHTLLTWSVTHTSPTTVALATLGEPIGAALLAWALLGEPLTALGIAACVLTLGAVGLALSDRG